MKNLISQLATSPVGTFALLSFAALLEVSGDACLQSGIYRTSGWSRPIWFAAGAAILLTYGIVVNLPRWNFGRLLGVYVALFFLIAQIVARLRFHQSPTVPIWVGGTLIVAGGLVITFWKT